MESIGDCSVDQLTVMYFLKVINLFEQFGYHDHVIELAQTAIAICDESDQNRVSHVLLFRGIFTPNFYQTKLLEA